MTELRKSLRCRFPDVYSAPAMFAPKEEEGGGMRETENNKLTSVAKAEKQYGSSSSSSEVCAFRGREATKELGQICVRYVLYMCYKHIVQH